MNDNGLSKYYWTHQPSHKPIISDFKDGSFQGYQCSDGDLVQYGYTKAQAAENYWLALKG
jgi:hypothetical protein